MQLNVRDRRIEAKIAYIGAQGGGKATNFEKLGGETNGDSLSLDWRPATASRFRDCDVFVKLVAERGEPTERSLRDLLRDADGVVLVADSDPSTHQRSQHALDLARTTISSLGRPDLPLLIQINQREGEGAPAPTAVLEAIGGADLPHVMATATRGIGVVETAERALEAILAAKGDSLRTGDARPTTRVEGNPLLTALRQVLRETVSEHLERQRARDLDAIGHLTQQVAELRATVEALVATQKAANTTEKLAELVEIMGELSQDAKRSKWGWFR